MLKGWILMYSLLKDCISLFADSQSIAICYKYIGERHLSHHVVIVSSEILDGKVQYIGRKCQMFFIYLNF